RNLALGDASLGRTRADETFYFRVRRRRPAALGVAVPAGAGLLPEAALLAQPVGHERHALALRREVSVLLLDPPADVQAGQVGAGERAHRHAEVRQQGVHLFDRRALLDEELRLVQVRLEHAVADEAAAVADEHADLAEPTRQVHRRGNDLRGRLLAAD